MSCLKTTLLRTLVFILVLPGIRGLRAQDSIAHRVIFVGDAGEINHQQETIIPMAAELSIPNKTTVLFLGDNIYPRGMGLEGAPEETDTQDILRSQYEPMRAKNIPVYFIPGNHDWDRMGKKGLAKVIAQGKFLETQQDSLLKLIPPNGCPDPVEIPLTDDLVIIAYDSEWWLFPHEKQNTAIECDCETEKDVLEKMEELRYNNRDKTILLASHHPFVSYGVHGGYYSWQDHLFPFTVLNNKLFIPLPGLGSLYPLLRSTVFLNPEDMQHPAYKKLREEVTDVFEQFPNIIYVAGHEHGLQLNKQGDILQVVSGAGAKHTYTKKGKNTLFAASMQGFVVVDQMLDKRVRITYYTYANHSIKKSFSYVKPYVEQEQQLEPLEGGNLTADSIITQANPRYNKVGSFHRKLFGENYRKEWAADTKLPIIKISEIHGGLKPLKRGGGMQSVSLRLEDSTGKQWVIRSVNKNSENLLPEELRHTFAEDFLDDANSAQHPYSALMVPPIAHAVNVPHANPIIGIIAPDTALGVYNKVFANTMCLLEEREPLGDSDNTIKMLKKVNNDNDDTYKAKTFLRARLVDLLIGDWDRHEDQWRWRDVSNDGDKDYLVVPRDRDQVLRLTEGFFPKIASKSWVLPTLQGFNSQIKNIHYSLFKSDFLNAHPKAQFSYDEWMEIVDSFVSDITDSVLLESVKRLPISSYQIRHEELFDQLKQRRDAIPSAMAKHYYFINNIVDIKLSNKHEQVRVESTEDKALRVIVRKINKNGEVKRKLMDKTYLPSLTKEVRIYLGSGNDSVYIANKDADIKLRVVGAGGDKDYNIREAKRNIHLYDPGKYATFTQGTDKLKKHLANDSANTSFVPVNLYNVWLPLITAGYNADDGMLLGGGFKYTHQRGFRKTPFTNTQQVLFSGAFATGAFKLRYTGHWKNLLGKADFIIHANVFAPNNTQNFFGLGNASVYDQENYSIRHYRARFSLYELHPSLQWSLNDNTVFSIGPTLQLYYYDPSDNEGRFINNSDLLHSYDSLTIDRTKSFSGLRTHFYKDSRNNKVLTTQGGFLDVELLGTYGLNRYSRSFLQAKATIALYGNIANEAIVLANRMGGGTTIGKTAFYQSLFLGGHGNLWGFRQYRFAGEHLFFNNFEARIKVAEIGSYIIPGQLGLIGFYDIGKVWASGLNDKRMHQGVGGGVYYSPAKIALFQLVAGHSNEGWYPYISLGARF
ncbi:metallophosphoesterase [Olivibacter sp. SDN3]|uniref:metallophosphoesterase n=1 Tax=Olivibacter sp. SDN3 TaxID=2764720 RepID=UPI0016511E28|nr:metallophosphoesterase [Olivibacter sp. SDN3]QNL50504.1 metallophosphoesterase [Olivibacter sp. SDN3]